MTKGLSIFKGISGLANKESNRIVEMQKVLKQVGIKTALSKDKLKIFGKGIINAQKKKILVPELGDHRICMSTFVWPQLQAQKQKLKTLIQFLPRRHLLKIMSKLGAKFEIKK